MARIGDGGDLLKCSFCGKSQKQVKKLIAGPGVYICDECIDLCNEIIEEELADADDVKLDELPKPAEIRVTPFSRRKAFTFFHSNVLFACVRLMTRPAPCEAEFNDSRLPLPLTTKPGEAIEPGIMPKIP